VNFDIFDLHIAAGRSAIT